MGSIVKRSPGYVNVEGKADTLAEVTAAFSIFNENAEILKDQYDTLHAYLSKMNLLRGTPERFDKSGSVAKFIRAKSQEFAANLDLDHETLDKLTGSHPLLVAKILLSYHRRLYRYQLFFAEGRVKLDDGQTFASIPSIDEILDD